MEAVNQVAAYISKLDQQPIRDHYLFWEILIYIRCKHKIYLDLKRPNETFLKTNTTNLVAVVCFLSRFQCYTTEIFLHFPYESSLVLRFVKPNTCMPFNWKISCNKIAAALKA